MEPVCGGVSEQRAAGIFVAVPIMESSQSSGHIVAAMAVNCVRIQSYEGADEVTL